MDKTAFSAVLAQHGELIERIRLSAHALHESVNQTYGDGLPYGYHLDMVASLVRVYGHLVCAAQTDVVPLLFGAYYHDSIEDARLTYNDVMRQARQYMDDEQALMATEIVYALTNDKGRTRAERAGERYYAGIRVTPYAPFVKLCDRMANISFSCQGTDGLNERMREIYRQELPHFLQAIHVDKNDQRFHVPEEQVKALMEIISED